MAILHRNPSAPVVVYSSQSDYFGDPTNDCSPARFSTRILSFPDGVALGSSATLWDDLEVGYSSERSVDEKWLKGSVVELEGRSVCIEWSHCAARHIHESAIKVYRGDTGLTIDDASGEVLNCSEGRPLELMSVKSGSHILAVNETPYHPGILTLNSSGIWRLGSLLDWRQSLSCRIQGPRQWQQMKAEAQTYNLGEEFKLGYCFFRIQRWWDELEGKIAEANEFLETCICSCVAINAIRVEVVGDLLHLTASKLNGDQFNMTLPAGSRLQTAAPQILSAARCPEGAPLKLVLPNGHVLDSDELLLDALSPVGQI